MCYDTYTKQEYKKGRGVLEMSRKLYKKNIKVIYDLLDIYTEVDGVAGRLAVERLSCHLDILTRAFGNDYDKETYLKYKEDNNLDRYANNRSYTQDEVYGAIKDMEFMIDYLDRTDDLMKGNFYEGLVGLLEPYAIVFNKWETYQHKLSDGESSQPIFKVEVEEEEEPFEEFTYEELVDSGVEPNYTVNEPNGFEDEPKTRTERNRVRRRR